MGVYVYSLRKKSIQVEMDDGSVITAVAIAYAYKPSWGYRDNPDYNRMIGRVEASAERAYEYFEGLENTPKHIVMYEPKDGTYESVYAAKNGLPTTMYDSSFDEMNRYEKVGEVKKTKRGRRVVYEHINMVKVELLARIEHIEGVKSGRIQVFS